jgi:peptidyl-prolyl cis-trans isomerase B (cyclophilin B)
MKIVFMAALILLFQILAVSAEEKVADDLRVELDTSKGKIVLLLFPEKAPETVKNFLFYLDEQFYDGTIFHRVIPNFMIQAGGFTSDMKPNPTRAPINNEADNGLKNERGTIAMARSADPHSATSQFFINCVDNDYLDHTSKTPQGWGYAVFGRVVAGMEVVDAISKVATETRGRYRDVPVVPVVINHVRRLK